MKLNDRELQDREVWHRAGITLPRFDRARMIRRTRERPAWVHFGAGNIFRAFPAALQQDLLDAGAAETGIVAAEGYDGEIIRKIYRPHDDLSLLVTLKSDGSIGKRVIGSVAESLAADGSAPGDFERLKAIFAGPSLQMASFTITEKGYRLTRADGSLLPDVARDFEAGPESPKSYLGRVMALVYARFRAGRLPLALVSMDNCSHNGDRLRDAAFRFAREWAGRGLADAGFPDYLADREKISFPWSMIDKITPRPDAEVSRMLNGCGFEDTETVVTEKHTYCAPFVNSEEAQYLVVEDWFPNGRPPLEKSGVIFTSRETVDKTEKMKVGTCLNPLHTALAVFGCLLCYTRICDEMKDADLRRLAEGIGVREGMPAVVSPGILDPEAFLREVLEVRLPNPFLPDTPQRIATDTSQKLSVRFGGTIRAYCSRSDLDIRNLRLIPLVLAGWCRYLLGVDDAGKPFAVSPDPLYESLSARLKGIRLGGKGPFHEALAPILSDARIFGIDLYRAGLGGTVERDLELLTAGPGAVRRTLHASVAEEK